MSQEYTPHDELYGAIADEDLEQAKYWLAQCNPKEISPWLVALAAGPVGAIDILKVMLEVCDASGEDSCALRQAAEYKNLEAVQLLLPLSDPTACQSEALYWACIIEDQQMFELLYPVSNPLDALQLMKDNGHRSQKYPGEYEGERMIRERLAQEEKAIICQSLPSSISSQKNKKI